MTADDIAMAAEEAMDKAVSYLGNELKGLRTGRANPGLIEHVKVEVYGSPTDLKQIAQISVQEGNQLMVRPFDPTIIKEIEKAIRGANIGLTPISDPKVIRLQVPALSGQVRKQLTDQARKFGEAAKVSIRNARRDANKAADTAEKDSQLSEDDAKKLKDSIQEMTKDYEGKVEKAVADRTKEIMDS